MARISYVEPQNAPPEVQEVYEQRLKGKPGNVHKAMAHRPEIFKNFVNFYASIGRGLETRLYEMVYIRVAMINRCNY
jgi:alkylhydroperoxidase family enzyme